MIKNCNECNSEFETKDNRKKFCNHSCAASFNNKIYKVRWPQCKGCSNRADPRRNRSGYCSTKCRQDHEIVRWLAGELDGRWKYTHASYVRRYLEQKTNGCCEHCGYNKTRDDGSSILQVDHIDGDWENNKPDNVRLLCPNCHCLTPTWGSGNMGKGRSWKSNYDQFGRLLGSEKIKV